MGSLGNTTFPHFPTDGLKHLDPEEFRKQAHQVVDFIADYYKNIESYPVLSEVEPGYLRNQLPETAPYKPESLETILEDIRKNIIPGLSHWLSPNFFAYFSATGSTAGFLGEMLCTSFNSAGFNWLASPAATELESIVMDWLAKLLKLPVSFMFSGNGGGVIQGSTSEAILCTIVAARDRALERVGRQNIEKLVVYGSDQTHSSYAKSCKIAGILPWNIRSIKTSADAGFALDARLLRAAMEADVSAGFIPVYLCATVGTTSTTAVDPLEDLTDVAREYNVWVHVDAAYAGSACICPEFRPCLDGVERVDSISMNPHKWLLTYLDCSCLWVKRPDLLVKGLAACPEFLRNKPSDLNLVVDYKDWQIGLSRRFRALKLWLVIRRHGVANLQAHIRSDVQMAKTFEGLVNGDKRFELVASRRFSLVCFRLNPYHGPMTESIQVDELNRKLLESVNSTGRAFITHTVVGGLYILRLAVGSTLTEEHHVINTWKLIKEKTDLILLSNTA